MDTNTTTCKNCKNNKDGYCTWLMAAVEAAMSCVRGFKKK